MIKRKLEIENLLEKNKVLVIYGPRQVGKTTLVKKFLSETSLHYRYFTGDQIDFARDFGSCDLGLIRKIIGNIKLLVIDEAQKIDNIGLALKLVVDNIDDIYVITTGSSSFDLANATSEPLTGRKNIVSLYPVSLGELASDHTAYELERNLEDYMIYGMYPNVLSYDFPEQKINRLVEIKDSYLIKDILEFQKIRNSRVIVDLLKLLAFQIGSEVSLHELGTNLGIDHKTVARYLDLLEKSFVLYRLDGFSRNLRKEVSRLSKYYFYDNGIRNALISNFNHLDTRDDTGQLWENFIFMQRIIRNAYINVHANYYFWRTYDKKEIDLIEERAGKLYGYEFKWKKAKSKVPKEFLDTYRNSTFEVVTSENYSGFVL